MGKRYYINNGWEFTEHWSDAFLCQGSREEGGRLAVAPGRRYGSLTPVK